ncbi:MAG: inorganic pyrophosphatase [Chlamydiales bacterium]|nr:inorganic pyrophosphatase [Chlamydiales bacterium]
MTEKSFLELLNLFSRAHPWHGVSIGELSPKQVHCYIEIVPTDTVKFELDKNSGLLKVDRPQKYSNYCPSLYGLIPQTYAGKRVGDYCSEKSGREGVLGDDDPLDVCILTERPILRGDIMVTAVPIGGIRAIDGNEADDKIIAVLKDDLVYNKIHDIKDCPENLIDRLVHYFLTYKESPKDLYGEERHLEVAGIYGKEEARHVIELAQQDYDDKFPGRRLLLHKK